MHHAFVDESVRPGRHLLTAVLVPSRDLATTTRLVRQLFPKGNRRTHLSAEGKDRRRARLKAYTTLGALTRVVVATYPGGPEEPARQACLRELVVRTEERRVGMLVLDSRSPVRDRIDRRASRGRFVSLPVPRPPQYVHRGSRDEPLLCLPDAIGWAVGAGGVWRQIVEPVVTEILQTDP